MGERKLEEQTCTKLEPTITDVSGFDFHTDSGEYAISGRGRVVIFSESGKAKKTLPFGKCLAGKEAEKDLKTTYDSTTNSVYILNTVTKVLKRFDFSKEQVKWETKIENGQYMPYDIFKGQKMIYVSDHDCLKPIAIETGVEGKVVKTKPVIDAVLGLFVDDVRGIAVVSSASDNLKEANKFAIVAV